MLFVLSLYVSHGKRKENYTAIFRWRSLKKMLSLRWNSASWGYAVMQGHKKSRVNRKEIVHCRQYRVVGLTQKRWDRYLYCSERRIQIGSLQRMCKKTFQLLHDVSWTWKCCQRQDRRGLVRVLRKVELRGSMEIPPEDRHRTPRK